MTTFRRVFLGVVISSGATALTVALVAFPLLAIDTSGGQGAPTNHDWLARSGHAVWLAALWGLLPGFLIAVTRANTIVGALIGGVWGFLLGALSLGREFDQRGAGLLLVGGAVLLPAAALGMCVAWAVNRRKS